MPEAIMRGCYLGAAWPQGDQPECRGSCRTVLSAPQQGQVHCWSVGYSVGVRAAGELHRACSQRWQLLQRISGTSSLQQYNNQGLELWS
jgi:hypothetical protein